MKYIKLALISFLIFFTLVTLVSLLFPSRVRISRALDIRAPYDSVYVQLSEPARWAGWFPGVDTMPPLSLMKKTIGYRINDRGALMRVSGRSDSSVRVSTSGPGVRDGEQGWNILRGDSPGILTVQWYLDFHLQWYPWEKFSSILFEKRYGPMLERGLEKLRARVER